MTPAWRVRPGSDGRRRDFRITVGLREGWAEDAPTHAVEEVVELAAAWMRERAAAGRPFLSGMITAGAVVYARTAPGGAVRDAEEPVAMFSGEALPEPLAPLPDADIAAMLEELAARLGAALGQEQIHLAYADRAWAIELQRRGSATV